MWYSTLYVFGRGLTSYYYYKFYENFDTSIFVNCYKLTKFQQNRTKNKKVSLALATPIGIHAKGFQPLANLEVD